MPNEPWSLGVSLAALLGAAVVLVFAGSRFVRIVDVFADRTGIGEAIAGAVLLGATTSLPGLVTTAVAADAGDADLAVSNCLGGIAAQTMFLALADLTYRRANLEHAAASLPNLLQTMVLVGLIAVVLLGAVGPDVDLLGVHPVSVLLVVVYLGSLVLVRRAREAPMWRAHQTPATRIDEPEESAQRASLPWLLAKFAVLAALVAGSGWIVARAGLSLASVTGLSGTLVGGLFTSVVTSLPELVTVFAAVRVGALTLAVGDIIGGNTFDVLFVSVADVAYREGSVYAAIGPPTLFLLALTLILTSILAAGLVIREERGIGFEGLALLTVYVAGFVCLGFVG